MPDRLCYCKLFSGPDGTPSSRCRSCPAYRDPDCQVVARRLSALGWPRPYVSSLHPKEQSDE